MTFPLRQNATHKVLIGPVAAVGDGFTPVTTLSLASADEAEVILHDNGTVVDISGYAFAAIAVADGYYHLTLQTGISGTVGQMSVIINDDSLCLPVREDFMVIEEPVYDALYAAGAVALSTAAAVAAVDAALVVVDGNVDIVLADTADMQPKLGAPAVDVSADIAAVKAETALIVADTNELQTDDLPATLLIITKLLRNKTITDPVTGVITVFEDDNVTPFFTANIFENAGGTQAYQGTGIDRRERLT